MDRQRHVLTSARLVRWLLVAASGALVAAGFVTTSASAAPRHFTTKKSIWGPVNYNDKPQFPIYHDLGAGIWQYTLNWSAVAPNPPTSPRDPADPSYQWPEELDQAVKDARRYKIRISLLVMSTPRWANGGREANWVPSPADLADFVAAASRRYPSVKLWMIWGEPSRKENFLPLTREKLHSKRLTRAQAAAPRYYARMLDASYAALKGISRNNKVIGGNTFTVGDITPYNWVRYMRLPNGRRPRMDLYGHNPFTGRQPLRHAPHHDYLVDFSDLPKFTRFLDTHGYRNSSGRPLRLFLSEFFFPTDHANNEFPFHVSWKLQASWLGDALRITMKSSRIYTLGWLGLYDDPKRADGLEVNRGLMTRSGRRKPSYGVFMRG
jgi:hypothetical protein